MSYNTFSTIIQKYFQRNGGWSRIKGELAVYFWPKVAGSQLAAQVEAVRFWDGSLYLQTDNPALAQQLSMMSQDIVIRFQKLLGSGIIKTIKIKVAPLKFKKSFQPLPAKTGLDETEEMFIKECTGAIPDPEMEDRFVRLMRKAICESKEKRQAGCGICKNCGAVTDTNYELCSCCQFHLKK